MSASHANAVQARLVETGIPVILGLLAFLAFTGGVILDPVNTGWLLGGDPGQHFVGWSFFRHSPWLQFPLGANPGYGEIISSSIVFSDSIPLLALLFKLLGPLLPDSFQYFGIWILLCFVLQGVFAWKLLGRFIDDTVARALASCFFIIAPPMLFRLESHEALAGQWVLLAALWLYFQEVPRHRPWLLLLGVTSLIHPYLLAMVLALWLTGLGRRAMLREATVGVLLCEAGTGLALVGALAWAIGYFSATGGAGTGGFGIYRMNLLALINGKAMWPATLPHPGDTPGDYEGYNYLGAGVITLALFNAYAFLVQGKRIAVDAGRVTPLLILSLGLTIYALSNQIAFGSSELFAYPLPKASRALTDTFRASGRFFWIAGYLLYLGLFVYFYRAHAARARRSALILLAALLVLQCADLFPARSYLIQRFSRELAQPLDSRFWDGVAQQYGRIAFAVPVADPPGYIPLAHFAARHAMSVNAGNIARVDPQKLSAARGAVIGDILRRQYDARTLYVFQDEALWQKALASAAQADFIGIVDGYRILAPGWKGCVATCSVSRAVAPASSNEYRPGSVLGFGRDGNAGPHLYGDWSAPEEAGRWTDGSHAFVSLKIAGAAAMDLAVTLAADALAGPGQSPQRVEVLANGTSLGALALAAHAHPEGRVLRFTIPGAVMAGRNGVLDLEFAIDRPRSPEERGMSRDARALGMFVRHMTIDQP